MPTYHKGNGGKITWGGTDLFVLTWSLTGRNRLAETTNSASSGYATWLAAVDEADWTAECFYDSAAQTVISAGSGGSAAIVFHLGDSGKTISFTGLIETVVPKVNNQQDAVKFDFTGKSSGAITWPS